MPPPTIDDDLSLSQRVEDFAIEALGLRQQVHQDLDCRWPVDAGCSEHDGTIGHSDVEGQARHGRIAAYQTQIAQAKHDLAHINASIRLFTDPEHQRARYMVSHGFFKKGEIADICIRHLRIDGELTTRELAERVMIERRLDATDTTLRNSVVFKVVQALRHAARRKLVRMVEKRKGVCHWTAGDAVTLRVVANSRTTPG